MRHLAVAITSPPRHYRSRQHAPFGGAEPGQAHRPPLTALKRQVTGAPPLAAALSDSGYLVAGFADHVEVMALSTGATAWSSPIPGALLTCESTDRRGNAAVRAINTGRQDGALAEATLQAARLATHPPQRLGVSHQRGWPRDGAARHGRIEVWTYAASAPLTGVPSVDGSHVAVASTDDASR